MLKYSYIQRHLCLIQTLHLSKCTFPALSYCFLFCGNMLDEVSGVSSHSAPSVTFKTTSCSNAKEMHFSGSHAGMLENSHETTLCIALTCDINIYLQLLKYKYDAIYSLCSHCTSCSRLASSCLTVFTEKLQNERKHHSL